MNTIFIFDDKSSHGSYINTIAYLKLRTIYILSDKYNVLIEVDLIYIYEFLHEIGV
jgi:hypothetical protein